MEIERICVSSVSRCICRDIKHRSNSCCRCGERLAGGAWWHVRWWREGLEVWGSPDGAHGGEPARLSLAAGLPGAELLLSTQLRTGEEGGAETMN
eukprot:SAG25_NODE_334_length_9571_cov_73.030511_14_plen_95_part_00